jgi:putative addiction module CopG family antidote
MDEVILPPDLERFAAEAVASGRYRDLADVVRSGVNLLRQLEAERAGLLASLRDAEAEADRDGPVSLATADNGMREAIEGVKSGRG